MYERKFRKFGSESCRAAIMVNGHPTDAINIARNEGLIVYTTQNASTEEIQELVRSLWRFYNGNVGLLFPLEKLNIDTT